MTITQAEYLKAQFDTAILTLGTLNKVSGNVDDLAALQALATVIFTITQEVMSPESKIDEATALIPMQEFIFTGACTFHGMRISLTDGTVNVTDTRQ